MSKLKTETQLPQAIVSRSVDDFDYTCFKCKTYKTNNLDNLFDHRQYCKIKTNKIKKIWNQLMQMLSV